MVGSPDSLSLEIQFAACTLLILTLGIPHGALDNVLYLRNKKLSRSGFIGIYLLIIGLNVLFWITLPLLAYTSFLLLSAYHFGQSQFTHYLKGQTRSHQVLFMTWGITVLVGLIYFNHQELQNIMQANPDFAVLLPFHQLLILKVLFLTASGCTLALLISFTVKKKLSSESFFMEVLVLALILTSFFLLPLLVGFTSYFVILHSFKVLREEYFYLSSERAVKSVADFVKLLTPFTLITIIGVLLLFGLSYFQILELSYAYVLLIVVSSISLPHIFVMNTFYQVLFRKNFYPHQA